MRTSLLILTAAAVLAAEPAIRFSSPVLGYVFDPASKSIRPIAGVPGAASVEGAIAAQSKIEIGFVSPDRRRLLAVTLDGTQVTDLQTAAPRDLPGAPVDIVLGAWSADSGSIALWSSTGNLQVWSGFDGTPSLRFESSTGSATGLALANGGESVLLWNASGLYRIDKSGSQQLIGEPVLGAAWRDSTGEWAAITDSQLLRSSSAPSSLNVTKPVAIAFTSSTILVAGEKAVGIVDETGSRSIACDCDPTSLHKLAGRDVFRLTGLESPAIAIYDEDSGETRISYIPTEGGRR
jgi:hypothetical protein